MSQTEAALIKNGSVTADDLASTLDLSGKTITLPSGVGGKVLQVVSTTKTDTTSQPHSPNVWYDISGMSLSITPTSTSNKVLVLFRMSIGTDSGGEGIIRLIRNSTAIGLADSASNRTLAFDGTGRNAVVWSPLPVSGQHLDSPSSTSAVTYKFQWASPFATATMYLNRSFNDGDSADRYRTSSSITLMEVAG